MKEHTKYEPMAANSYKLTPVDAPLGFDCTEHVKNALEEVKHFSTIFIFPEEKTGWAKTASGVYVNCCGMDGILTANHVAQRLFRQRTFALSITENQIHSRIEYSEHLEHIPIGEMNQDEQLRMDGPDLSFLAIRDTNLLETIRSKKSFCYLDSKDTRYFDCDLIRAQWAISGCPLESFKKVDDNYKGEPLHKLTHFVGHMGFQDHTERGDFDYIELIATSATNPFPSEDFPSDYAGMSGGGFWLLPIETDENNKITHGPPILAGITFYESEPFRDRRVITGHGFKSIYKNVSQALKNHKNGLAATIA